MHAELSMTVLLVACALVAHKVLVRARMALQLDAITCTSRMDVPGPADASPPFL